MILREQLYTASVPMEHTELTPVKRDAEHVNKKWKMSDSSPPQIETYTSVVLQAILLIWLSTVSKEVTNSRKLQ